ncbi:hypothetical protein KI387_032430, partial [Taxus chinensis]
MIGIDDVRIGVDLCDRRRLMKNRCRLNTDRRRLKADRSIGDSARRFGNWK